MLLATFTSHYYGLVNKDLKTQVILLYMEFIIGVPTPSSTFVLQGLVGVEGLGLKRKRKNINIVEKMMIEPLNHQWQKVGTI